MIFLDRSEEKLPTGRLPRWRTIQLEIEEWLESGRFPPGSQLPTEEELAEEFDVHRHTVRRALAQLRLKDLVRTEQGRGIFVKEANFSYRIGKNTKMSNAAGLQGRSVGYRMISVDPVSAIHYGSPLGLPKGHPLIRIIMVRVMDGRDIGILRSYYPLPRFDGIAQRIAASGSVGTALAEYGVEQINRKSLHVKAVMPDAHESKILNLERPIALLEMTHLAVDSKHIPIEFSISKYDGRYFDIHLDF